MSESHHAGKPAANPPAASAQPVPLRNPSAFDKSFPAFRKAVFGSTDAPVTLFAKDREDITSAETAALLRYCNEADDAGSAVYCGMPNAVTLTFKDKQAANGAPMEPDVSFVVVGADGSYSLVYLTEGSGADLVERLVARGFDASTDFPVPGVAGYRLHDGDVGKLDGGEPFTVYDFGDLEKGFFPVDDAGDVEDTGLSADEETVEVSKLNDAEVHGSLSDDVLKSELQIAVAARRDEKVFKVSPVVTFQQFLNSDISKIRVGKKDGKCFVPGVLMEGRRVNPAVTKLYMMGLDVDSGASMEETLAKLRRMGLFFISYTTHSHGTGHLEIKKDRFYKWADDNGHPTEPSTEGVKLFLTDEAKYTADVIASAEYVETVHESTGIQIVVRTRPIDKFRLVFLLDKPYVIAEQKMSQKEAIVQWGDMILGMGAALGIKVDRAARDCSRLFYLPSRDAKSTNAKIVINAGKKLDWTTIEKKSIREHNEAVDSDPYGQAGAVMGGNVRGRAVSPQKGLDLQQWARETAHGFQISEVFKEHCDDRLREETSTGKFTVECPFDDDHSNAGDPDDKGCFIHDAGSDAQTFAFRCSHDSCSGRDRLDMLQKAMKDGWFTDDVLTDPDYNIAVDDKPAAADVDGDDEPADPATPFLGLNALIKKAIAEKAEDEAASASTMEALMDCVARQKSRVPIYERIKASKIAAMTDFKKEVEKRARDYSKAAEVGERKQSATHYPRMVVAIEALNAEIALVERGSDVVIYQKRETGDGWKKITAAELIYRPWTAGKTFDAVFPVWLASSHRDHRTDIVFEPFRHGDADPTPANYLNMYKGLAVIPRDSFDECMAYLRHVFHVVCCGNKRLFAYFMEWAADMVQNPGEKPGTSLILHGLKGTGKGLFAAPLRQIWGLRHSTKVNNSKQLTGNFNGHMDAKILVIAEESTWGGDRKADSVIKDMITSDTMMFERKFMDAIELPDHRRFIFLSNEENVIRATPDERRYAVTVVPDERKHDDAYFKPLVAQIKSGRLAPALAHLLLDLDIRMDLHKPPRTDALVDQILTNLSAEDKWLRAVLTNGTFPDAVGDSGLTNADRATWAKGPLPVSKETIYVSYRSMVKSHDGKEVSPDRIGDFLMSTFREERGKDSLITIIGNGATGRNYVLPALPELVSFYEKKFGLPLHCQSIENDDDFIRVKNPKVAKIPEHPKKPTNTGNPEAVKQYREKLRAYVKARKTYRDERAEVWKDADEFINAFFGRVETSALRDA